MKIELLTKYVEKVFSEIENNIENAISIKKEFLNNPFLNYLILYNENRLVGYLSFNKIYDKVDIVNVFITEQERNKGYATELFKYLINYCYNNNIINITLEVNIENDYAIKLYKKFDFIEVAIRKGYYNGIDGILMERKLM